MAEAEDASWNDAGGVRFAQPGAEEFGDGAEFILREAREHPGEITLIGIGPLFTVQAAIERDPAAFRKLRRVVIMGGSIERGYGVNAQGKPNPPQPEWNILCNPAGAKALLASGVPVFMMPLDSTQVPLDLKNRGDSVCARITADRAIDAALSGVGAGTPTTARHRLVRSGGGDVYLSARSVPGKADAY